MPEVASDLGFLFRTCPACPESLLFAVVGEVCSCRKCGMIFRVLEIGKDSGVVDFNGKKIKFRHSSQQVVFDEPTTGC